MKALLIIAALYCVGCVDPETRAIGHQRQVAIAAQYKAAADACIAAGGVPMYCTLCDVARMTECKFKESR